MNLVLLEPEDFTSSDCVTIRGRRLKHIVEVHRARVGSRLRVGLMNGKIGEGCVESLDEDQLAMRVQLSLEPPPPLPVHLVLALPRPKVLNRIIAAATSMGICEIDLFNAWRVEKAYWSSPRLSEDNLRRQAILGLEQAVDTHLPQVRLHKLFAPFVREELPSKLAGKLALLAEPGAREELPRQIGKPVVLVLGPEGGFIERELATFEEIGFQQVRLGPRILRVETALACIIGRLL